MTREEAIRIAQGLISDFKCDSDIMVDFCNTVIKALEQEPCEDAISRQRLYNKIAEMEEFSKLDLLETKPQIDGKININYAWYLAKLMDRTRFLKMIADEPSVKGE